MCEYLSKPQHDTIDKGEDQVDGGCPYQGKNGWGFIESHHGRR
jgi:hypothetical protein